MKNYSQEELTAALERIQKQYPSVFTHFFMAEVDPVWYKQFIDNLGKEDDSRQSDSGLGQK